MNEELVEENKQLIEAKELTTATSGVRDSHNHRLSNNGYNALHYTFLDFNITGVESGVLQAITTIVAQAKQDLSSFNLDFVGFEIARISVNGELAKFSRDGQELTITPTNPLRKGDSFHVEITYSGSPELN